MTESLNSYLWLKPFPRVFVDSSLKLSRWEEIEPYYQKLLNQKINLGQELEEWLRDWGEVEAIVQEEGTSREVAMTCNTENPELKQKHIDFIQNFVPGAKRYNFLLSQKYEASPHKLTLSPYYQMFNKYISTKIRLFKEENLPLEMSIEELCQKYQEITGAWTVFFQGKERTLPEMGIFLQSTDRKIREEAWHASGAKRLESQKNLDQLYTDMIQRRHQVAQNLNLKDYRDYAFKEKMREYTPEECYEFHESVEKTILPLVKKIRERRKRLLKLETLRPWDLECDPRGLPPLHPFDKIPELQNGVEAIFGKIDPTLKNYFHSIRPYQDLDSRKGKAPGGYQATFPEKRIPFIFTNAAGLQRDVETLLHEGGHAFHSILSRDQQLYWYRHAPMEFCEVASMSQELLGGAHLGIFYRDVETSERARVKHLESVLEIFPWIMTVDAFQHWVYTHVDHSLKEREEEWKKQLMRFNAGVDWSDIDPWIMRSSWHKQLHIFLVPFYYIEYAISQLGALQIYRNYKKDKSRTLSQFYQALSRGGNTTCRELYQTAGIEFRFDTPFLQGLADMVATNLSL